KHHDNTKVDPNKKSKVTCWKCGKPGHLKKDCKGGKVGNKANGSGINGSVDGSTNSLKGQNMFNKSFQVYYVTYVSEAYYVQDDDVAWWVDSGATVHVCKDRCWFKTYESLNDGSILHMGNESTALVHRRGCVDLKFSSGKIVSLFNVLHVPNIRKNLVSSSVLNNCGYKQVIESNKFVLSKHGVFIGFGYLSNQMFRLNIVNDNIASAFMSTSKLNDSILWHARLGHVHFKRMQDMSKDGLIPTFDMDTEKCKTCMLTKITKKPFQNVKRETKVLELIHSDLCDLHATPSLGNKKYFVTFVDDASRTELRVLGAVVRLPDPKLKTLGEKGIECIFVGYNEHSKAFRFYVIKPNDSVLINSIIESRDAIFDENRFSSVLRPSLRIPNETEDIGGLVVPEEVTKEDDPKTFDEAVLSNGYLRNQVKKCVYGKFDESGKGVIICLYVDDMLSQSHYIEKVLKKLNYFDCAPGDWLRISTIRLLIAMASIHNLIIHQMDVKIAFLNGELDEEVYMNQPQGFIMPGNEYKVCKLIKSLYGLKQTPKQWHQKFDEVVLSNGYLLNQVEKCVYSKFDESGKGVIICLYVDDMLSQSHYIEKVLKKLNYFDCAPVSTPMDTSEKLMPDNGQVVSQLEYTSNPEGYTDASWISNSEDNSSTSGWVFLLGGGVISWASKKQTCITGSTMESEFVALAAVGKEAEWLENLLLEISLWSKPIAPISICRDSAATLAKAYSQMYNGKSRHLGVRHNIIRELITNGVVSIEFVRICLEPAEKKDEVVNFLMVNFFEKVLRLDGVVVSFATGVAPLSSRVGNSTIGEFSTPLRPALAGAMIKEETPMYSNRLKGSILLEHSDSRIFKRVM
ncbi:zinc finger, CCHC-type containing protein, partial [Tanacetum coccineum]